MSNIKENVPVQHREVFFPSRSKVKVPSMSFGKGLYVGPDSGTDTFDCKCKSLVIFLGLLAYIETQIGTHLHNANELFSSHAVGGCIG